MTKALSVLARRTADALRDLAPIILVIAFFQIVVLQQPFPNLGSIVVGLLCVVVGLTLFIQGLESGLFPLGEAIAQAFARKGSAAALLGFAFCLGFGTTVAEPALIAVAAEAAEVASQAGAIADDERARIDYAFELRITSVRGEGLEPGKAFFGLDLEARCDVVLFLVVEPRARDILERIRDAGRFEEERGAGIAFQVPIEDAVGLVTQLPTIMEELEDAI